MTIRLFGKLTPIRHLLPGTRKRTSLVIFPKASQSHLHVSPRRLHSTIFAPAWPRVVEKEVYEELIDTLTFLLRRAVGREHGLRNRDDDYVSVKELVGVPFFSRLLHAYICTLVEPPTVLLDEYAYTAEHY